MKLPFSDLISRTAQAVTLGLIWGLLLGAWGVEGLERVKKYIREFR